MLLAESLLFDPQGALKERGGARILALNLEEIREAVEGGSNIRMLRAEYFLFNCQGPPQQRLNTVVFTRG